MTTFFRVCVPCRSSAAPGAVAAARAAKASVVRVPIQASRPSCIAHKGLQVREVLPPRSHPTSRLLRCSAAVDTAATASPELIKEQLLSALDGLDRGIFGVKAAEKEEIHSLIEALEGHNPTPKPTADLSYVAGDWALLYSTISIMGSKRTKLGLREFVKLGEFIQSIDVESKTAVNEISFAVSGLGQIKGAMTVTAGYDVASDTRVDIDFQESTLVPEGLLKIFQKNYDLLLGIFNPDGWLEITYVDDSWRVGRDDKGNLYLLRRAASGGEGGEEEGEEQGGEDLGGDEGDTDHLK